MGKQNARVEICSDPLLGGIGEAMKSKRIQEIVDDYDGMIDIFCPLRRPRRRSRTPSEAQPN